MVIISSVKSNNVPVSIVRHQLEKSITDIHHTSTMGFFLFQLKQKTVLWSNYKEAPLVFTMVDHVMHCLDAIYSFILTI